MTKQELLLDVDFLSKRQANAGIIHFSNERDYGLSSNSIVSIAYGLIPITKQIFPSDYSDMAACENMWDKLPKHRKKGDALKAMEAARHCILFGIEKG